MSFLVTGDTRTVVGIKTENSIKEFLVSLLYVSATFSPQKAGKM